MAPEGWKLFAQYLGKAQQELDAAGPGAQDSPVWHLAAMQAAGSQGRPAPEQEALYGKAIQKFPQYYMLHESRVNYVLPQWGGSYQQVGKVVDDAVRTTQPAEGTANYALLYHFVSRRLYWDEFTQSGWKWARMKAGFEDLVTRHNDAYNWALYGYWACRTRDREATARVFKAMGPRADVGGFHSSVTTDGCRVFASGG